MRLNIDSLIIMDWKTTKGNIHDSSVAHDIIYAAMNFHYILADSAYDTSEIYGIQVTEIMILQLTSRLLGIIRWLFQTLKL